MKRWYTGLLVFALAATLFSAVGVKATECSNDNQELFAISSVTNAHGEVWDQTNYGPAGFGKEICYDDYFLGTYSGSSPHAYNGNNVVLRLSGLINAHAESPNASTPGYSNVSFGDLICFLQAPGKNCNETPLDNGFCLIVSLNDTTNTHLSLTNAYARSLCCKSASKSCRCNYNRNCDSNLGETPLNCPDCVAHCGNGVVEGIEECDSGNLSGKDCTNYKPKSPYIGGSLSCDGQCKFNTDGCNYAQCSDGGDNETVPDGLIDAADPGCWEDIHNPLTYNPQLNDESRATSECQDTIDNDGDGATDMGDPDCTSPQGYHENVCGNGVIEPGFEPGSGEECDCGNDGCTPEELDNQNCTTKNHGTGDLGCNPETCKFDYGECAGYDFCFDPQYMPFEFQDSGGAWLAPSSCQDYNQVYEGDNFENQSLRKQLCENDCVPGASDPVNNGYGGEPLTDWGCRWDGVNKECYFYFNNTNSDEGCRLDYNITEDCGSDNPFRLVEINAYTQPLGGDWVCKACEDGSNSCETQIMCPRVIQLPFIGAFGIALAIVIIALVYACLKRKK